MLHILNIQYTVSDILSLFCTHEKQNMTCKIQSSGKHKVINAQKGKYFKKFEITEKKKDFNVLQKTVSFEL